MSIRRKDKIAANLRDIREVMLQRQALTDEEFIQRAALTADKPTLTIVALIRKRLAEVSNLPLGIIWPNDAFDGDFGKLQQWPEFEKSIDLVAITRELGLRLDLYRLDRVVDPSSPRRRGTVSDFVRELRAALLNEDNGREQQSASGSYS